MLDSIKNIKDLENINELVSLSSQVDELTLQDKLGTQNIHENAEKLFEPLTDTIEISLEIFQKL